MQRMPKYIFSIGVLLLITINSSAQTKRIKGLRLGIDVSRFSLYYFQPERKGYEFSGDFEIKRDLYLTGEYGIESVTLEKPNYNYMSDGYYYRFGFDKNFLKSETPDDYEMVFLGFRYGYANQKHSADNIIINNPYWSDISNATILEKECSTHWIELVAGVRAELIRNVALGWSVRGRLRLSHKGYDSLTPYNVPGYGNGSKKSNLGFNFSLYFRIPIYKQTVDYTKNDK
jgi:hypothetical protein